ncbi:hypothetical protein AVEN_117513-1, partial [Araneus ventricosus]
MFLNHFRLIDGNSVYLMIELLSYNNIQRGNVDMVNKHSTVGLVMVPPVTEGVRYKENTINQVILQAYYPITLCVEADLNNI